MDLLIVVNHLAATSWWLKLGCRICDRSQWEMNFQHFTAILFAISYMDSNIFFKNHALQDLLTTIVLTCHVATILILQILVGKVTKPGYVINQYNFDIYSLIIHYSSRSSKTPRKMDAYRDPIKVIPKAIYPRLTIIAVIINQLRSLTTCP